MTEPWRGKLDPRSRAVIEGADPDAPIEVLLGLAEPLRPGQRQALEAAGLTLNAVTGSVVGGTVANRAALQRVAAADDVLQIEISRSLHAEGP
jgi:hypothetical protein